MSMRVSGLVVLWVSIALTALGAQEKPTTFLSVPGGANATAWIAADASRVAVTWGAHKGAASDVYLAVSTDAGRTFGAPTRVNDRAGTARLGGEMAPRVAFVPLKGGTAAIEVLWTSRDVGTTLRMARSLDGGRTFGASRELQGEKATGDRGWAAFASDSRGGAHAIWLDHRRLATEGTTAGTHHHTSTATSSRDASSGFAMAQSSGLYYSNGSGERELAKGVCYCCKTALSTAPDGTLFAAWRHVYTDNTRDIAFTVSRDGGRTFAPPARVSEDHWRLDGCPDDGPAMAVDATGMVYLVWPTVVTQPQAHKAMFFASTHDGRVFTPRVRVSPIGRNIAHPQIATSPEGDLVALWDEIVSGQRRVFLSRRTAGGTFALPEALTGNATASYPVSIFADGAFVVAWTEGGGDNSKIAVRRVSAR